MVTGKKGIQRRMPLMTVRIFPAAYPYSRYAVVVGTRVLGGAVKRNAVRRIIMDIIEKQRASWPIADYYIIIQPSGAHASREQLYENLISVCAR